MADRYEQTTSIIRDAAVRELVERGHSLFTMESVAQRSYSSIGSVYARFPNRSRLLADILTERVLPSVRELRDHGPDGTDVLLRQVFGDPTLGTNLHALVEIALAARLNHELIDGVREGIRLLHDSFHLQAKDEKLAMGVRYDLTVFVLGYFVMSGAGCSIPPLSIDLANLVRHMLNDSIPEKPAPSLPTQLTVLPPPQESRQRDEVSDALINATGKALVESGFGGAHLRDIAKEAGVSTGAVYRRYKSKSDLLTDGLSREINSGKHGWTGDFMEALLEEPSGFRAAEMMADKVQFAVEDETRLLAGIEILHAARADELVRQTLASQVHAAANNRSRMLEELVGAGVARSIVSPQLFGWLPQIRPAGDRVLALMGMKVERSVLVRSLQAYLRLIL